MTLFDRLNLTPLSIGVAFALFAVFCWAGWKVSQSDSHSLVLELEAKVEEQAKALQRELCLVEEGLLGMGALVDAGEDFDQLEFERAAIKFLERHPTVQAMEWVEVVQGCDKDEFTARMKTGLQAEGWSCGVERQSSEWFDFEITEKNSMGELVRAANNRETYFPVTYVYPMNGNRPAWGYDLGSSDRRLHSIQLARDSGHLQATRSVDLVQVDKEEEQKGILLFLPVYDSFPNSKESRQQHFKGLMLCVVRVELLLGSVFKMVVQDGLNVEVTEDPTNPCVIYSNTAGNKTEDSSDFVSAIEKNIQFAGQTWTLCASPNRLFDTHKPFSLGPWIVVFGVVLIGISLYYTTRLERARKQLVDLAETDPLTKLLNRRKLMDGLEMFSQNSRSESKPVAMLMIDVDYFKQYNDHYGHLAGDNCLVRISQCLSGIFRRTSDFVCRYGGEEFCIVLYGVNDVDRLASKIVAEVRELAIPHARSPVANVVTVSVGGVSLVMEGEGSKELMLGRCDALLYQAKESGRDRYKVADFCEQNFVKMGEQGESPHSNVRRRSEQVAMQQDFRLLEQAGGGLTEPSEMR